MHKEKIIFFILLSITLTICFFTYIIIPFFINLFFFGNADDPIILIIVQFLGSIIPLLIILYFFEKKLYLFNFKEQINFKNLNKKYMLLFFVLGILTFFLIKFGVIFIENLYVYILKTKPKVKLLYKFKITHFISLIFAYAIIPSIYEEILYRLIFYKAGYSKISAFLISTVPFAFMHFPIINVFSAFIIGSIFFFIRQKNKNIIYLIMMHFVINILSIVFSNYIILPIESSRIYEVSLSHINFLIYSLISLFCFLFLLMSLIILLRQIKVKHENEYSQKNKWSKSTIIMLIFSFTIIIVINILNK